MSEFFANEESLTFTIEAPISQLKKQRGDDPDWLEGMVAVQNPDGSQFNLKVELKARGNFPYQFHPLRIPAQRQFPQV